MALVTGGGAGIGAGIVRRFADEGARVVVAELDEDAGRSVAAEIGGLFVRTDVSDRAQVENTVAATVSEYGSVDVLVNNAWGGAAIGRVEDKTDDQLARGVAVGYYGPFWAMRAAFPEIRAAGGDAWSTCAASTASTHTWDRWSTTPPRRRYGR